MMRHDSALADISTFFLLFSQLGWTWPRNFHRQASKAHAEQRPPKRHRRHKWRLAAEVDGETGRPSTPQSSPVTTPLLSFSPSSDALLFGARSVAPLLLVCLLHVLFFHFCLSFILYSLILLIVFSFIRSLLSFFSLPR